MVVATTLRSLPNLPITFSIRPQPTLSPSRLPTPNQNLSLNCPHFQSCSGCTHEFQLHHPPILDEAVAFFNNIGFSSFTFDTCRIWGWRCRAKLAVRGSSAEPLIGLYEEGTHNVVDIPECRDVKMDVMRNPNPIFTLLFYTRIAHHPSINAAVNLLKQAVVELNIQPYDEDNGTGELRYVQMAVTTYNTSLPSAERYQNGKVQVTLVWNSRNESSPKFEKLKALANYLWNMGGAKSKVHLMHSLWANFQTSTNFWEHVGGIDISLAPSSFGQANTQAFDSLLRRLQKYVPRGSSVVDLYSGAGIIGLSLAITRKCRSVKCVEVNKESKFSFEKTASRLPPTDCSISWHHADLSKESFSWIVGSDVVIVDPPRKGLDPSLVIALQSLSLFKPKNNLTERRKVKSEKRPWILRGRESSVQSHGSMNAGDGDEESVVPETLIYISCGWDRFKEDCMSLLSNRAWFLHKAHGFNFFPGTQSIEVLAVFKRGSGVPIKSKKSRKNKSGT